MKNCNVKFVIKFILKLLATVCCFIILGLFGGYEFDKINFLELIIYSVLSGFGVYVFNTIEEHI